MKPAVYLLLIFVSLIPIIFGSSPVVVQYKCYLWDSPCLTASAQAAVPIVSAGFPELDVDAIDPLPIERLHIDQEGFKHDWIHAHAHGLRNSIIDKLSVDLDKKLIRLMFHANFTVVGQYASNGVFFTLPVLGHGDMSLKFDNVQIELIIPFDIIKQFDDKHFMDLKSYQYWYDIKGDTNFAFDNLYHGNKELSQKLHILINHVKNSKVITKKYGRYMLDLMNDKIFNAIRAYLHNRPLETVTLT